MKRRALLQAFGSLQGVKEASLEQVAALEGFSESSARKLLEGLGVELPPKLEAAPDPASELATDAAPEMPPDKTSETTRDTTPPDPTP